MGFCRLVWGIRLLAEFVWKVEGSRSCCGFWAPGEGGKGGGVAELRGETYRNEWGGEDSSGSVGTGWWCCD